MSQNTENKNGYISSYWRWKDIRLATLIPESIQQSDSILEEKDKELISLRDEVILHSRNEGEVCPS